MSIALEILLARNSRDAMLVADPNSTYFSVPLIDHAPFQKEYRAIPYPSLQFGESIACAIPTIGDLLAHLVLSITLPSVTVTDGLFRWKREIGYQIIQSISLQIGQTLIQTISGPELQLWQQLHRLPLLARGPDHLYRWQSSHQSASIQIPIPFFFSEGAASSLPLYLLAIDQEVLVTIQFSSWEQCVQRSDRLLLLDQTIVLADPDSIATIGGNRSVVARNDPLANELLLSRSSSVDPIPGDLVELANQTAIVTQVEIISAEPDAILAFRGTVQLVYYQLSEQERDLGRLVPWQTLFRSMISVRYPILQSSNTYPLLSQARCASIHWEIFPRARSWQAKIMVDGTTVSEKMPGSYYQIVEPFRKYPILPELGCYCSSALPGAILEQSTLDLERAKSAFLQLELGQDRLIGMTLALFQIGYRVIAIANGVVSIS